VTHRPVRGRRITAVGLALCTVVVLVVVVVYLALWWTSGVPPLVAS
jgi:hypothetical protein